MEPVPPNMNLTRNIKLEMDTEEIIKAAEATCTSNNMQRHEFSDLIKEQSHTKCDCTECASIVKGTNPFDADCFIKHEIKTEETDLKNETGTIDQVLSNIDRAVSCFKSTGLIYDEEKISISEVKVEFSDTYTANKSTEKEPNVAVNNTFFETQTTERITKPLKTVANDVLFDSQTKKEVDIKCEIKGLKIILNDFLWEPWSGRKVTLRDFTILLVNLRDEQNHLPNCRPRADQKRKTLICEHCAYKTSYIGHFEKHVERHVNPRIKPKPEMLYCYNCPYKTERKYFLVKHQIIHSKIKPFQCKFCPKKFLREKQVQLHRFCKHADEISDLEKQIMKKKMRLCNVCPFKTIYSTRLNSHMASKHPNSETPTFRCDKCDYTCFVKAAITLHLKKHSNAKRLSCMYCDSTLKTRCSLMNHLFHVHKEERHNLGEVMTRTIHKCQFCDYQILFPRTLAHHIRNKHKKLLNSMPNCNCQQKHCLKCSLLQFLIRFSIIPKTFRCNYCKMQFDKKRQINMHLFKRHKVDMQKAGEVFPIKIHNCKWCKYQDISQTHLSQHVAAKHKHMVKPEFKCALCGREFYRKGSLAKHLEAHADVKQFTCKPCGVEFRQKRYMDTHIFIHHKDDKKLMKSISYKMYDCPQCSYATSYADRLDSHRKYAKAHKKPKIYKCKYCEMQFEENRKLNMHLFKQHRNDIKKAGEVFPIKIYKCKWCEYQVLNPGHLDQHVVSKHKKKITPDFKCALCGLKFYLKRQLTNHIERHSDVKRFTCKPCGVGFRQKRYMDTHIFIHHKDDKKLMESISYKIFECSHCLYATSYADRLDTHRRCRAHAGSSDQ